MKKDFIMDLKATRANAHEEMEKGAVTDAYRADVQTVVKLLNESLATEIVCVLRYRRHHFMAKGIHAESVAAEFMQHSIEEQGHADEIAARITQLGGEPNFNPEGMLTRSHADYAEGRTLTEMIKEDLFAERIAIGSYTQMIQYLGGDDPTTRRMLEGILAVEEQHADDLARFLANRASLQATAQSARKTSTKIRPEQGASSDSSRHHHGNGDESPRTAKVPPVSGMSPAGEK
jgi:bacterioferritin